MDAIFSERTIFTFLTGVVCRARWPSSGEAFMIHAGVERWQHCLIHYFCCVQKVSALKYRVKHYCKMVQRAIWDRMLGDEGDQQEEDCYHGDEDASRDPRSVETR